MGDGSLRKVALWAARRSLSCYPSQFRARHGQSLLETLQDQVESALQLDGFWRRSFAVMAELANASSHGLRMRMQFDRHPAAHKTPPHKGAIMLESLFQDARFALRGLLRQPGFAAAAIAVLAIGIGLNTAAFSLVNAYLLRPLPFPDSQRLFSVSPLPRTATREDWRALPSEAWQTRFPVQDEVIESLVAWDLDLLTLVGEEGSEAVEGAWVTPGYFQALGTQAHLGRVFEQSDAAPGKPVVAVISYGLWQSRFGGDPGVLGRSVSAFAGDRPDEAESLTVIGVLPRDFWFLNRYTGILPILKAARLPSLVKVRPGVSIEQARQHLSSFVRDQASMPEDWQMQVVPAQDVYVFNVKPVLTALSGAVGLVLLLACANVAILLLVRALRRHRELVVRRALGASRVRLMRLLVVEGLALSLIAGLLGSALGWAVLQGVSPLVEAQLRTSAPGGIQRLVELHPTVLALSIGVAVLTGLLFALAPAIAASGLSLASALNNAGRGGAGGRRHHWLRSGLIVAEVALSLTLLIGAALMIRSAAYLGQVNVGFDAQNVLTAELALRRHSYPEAGQQIAFVDQLLPRIRALPQVEAAGIQASYPFQQQATGRVLAEGIGSEADSGPTAAWYVVSPGHLEALRIPLIRGRLLQESDRAEVEPVAVISQSLADQMWPGGNPLGNRIRYAGDDDEPWRSVVGVVGDVRETLTGPEAPDCYLPFAQSPHIFMFLNVRWSGAPAATVSGIRQILADIDPGAALHRVEMMEDLVTREGTRPRFLAGALGGFSAFAVVLAMLGLGSLISYTVGQRRHEIAVRMALGAAPGQVRNLFLAQGGKVVAAGLVAGILFGVGLTGALSSQLYGVQPSDWPTYAMAAALLCAAALAAVWLSARGAEKADPTTMLKQL